MGRALGKGVHLYIGITIPVLYLPECSKGYLEKEKSLKVGIKP